MVGGRFDYVTLTNARLRQAALLTLLLPLIFTSHHSHADPLPQIAQDALKARVSEVTTYVRKEALQGIHILPDEARELTGWFNGSWKPVNVSGDDEPPAADGSTPTTVPLTQTQTTSSPKTFGFSTNFHHKGFLPTHDTMMMGVDVNQAVLPNKLNFTARPFWGQSWNSIRAYYGAEASLDIAKKIDDELPSGKIVIGYIGGEDALTDHGSGIEMHGDVDLTEGWKFTSGIRQNSSDGNSNYMMVKYKLEFF
jgi:hypothetical protein